MHRPSVLHVSIYFSPGNPGQKQGYLSWRLPSPCSGLQLPSHPYPEFIGSCWAPRAASPFSKAQDPEHTRWPSQVTFSKRLSRYSKSYHFHQGSCNVCCSCSLNFWSHWDCVRIVTFHLRKRFYRSELCSWENVNYLTIWLQTIVCPNT